MSEFVDSEATRAMQDAENTRRRLYEEMTAKGVYNIVKVSARIPGASLLSAVGGYLTYYSEISGKTAKDMEIALGLRHAELAFGAHVYRLAFLPGFEQIEERGYTTLVDGKRLKAGLKSDSHGYRPGQMLRQFRLRGDVRIPAVHLGTVSGSQRFDGGAHPDTARMYPEGHPVWKNVRP